VSLAVVLPLDSNAQVYDRPFEVFLTTGWDHVSRGRFDDNSVVIGMGIGLRLSSKFGVEVEYNQLPGLSPRPVSCGSIGDFVGGVFVPFPCVGTGRDGADRFSLVSANALYRLSGSRVQPYVSGGAGVDWSRSVSSISFLRANQVIISETSSQDTGFVWNVGAGARFYATPRFSMRPDLRYYNAVLLSSHNLRLIRFGISFGFHW
jgi:opacity protein-like surface antigen